MIKYCWIYILLLIISYFDLSNGSSDCAGETNSAKECRALLTEEDEEDGFKCCLVKGTKNRVEVSECQEYDEESYQDLDAFKQYLTNEKNIQNPEVNCKSYYLQFTLLTLILFLL